MIISCILSTTVSFHISRLYSKHTRLYAKENVTSNAPKKNFTFKDLFTLVSLGAGAPSLGEYEYTDENGKMFFKLEANNAYDAEGNSIQSKSKYFIDGYSGNRDGDDAPPSFWSNLLSGGSEQTKWEERLKAKQNMPKQ